MLLVLLIWFILAVQVRGGYNLTRENSYHAQMGFCEVEQCLSVELTLLSHIAVMLLLDFMIGACCLPKQHHASSQRPLLACATSVQLIYLTMYILSPWDHTYALSLFQWWSGILKISTVWILGHLFKPLQCAWAADPIWTASYSCYIQPQWAGGLIELQWWTCLPYGCHLRWVMNPEVEVPLMTDVIWELQALVEWLDCLQRVTMWHKQNYMLENLT